MYMTTLKIVIRINILLEDIDSALMQSQLFIEACLSIERRNSRIALDFPKFLFGFNYGKSFNYFTLIFINKSKFKKLYK